MSREHWSDRARDIARGMEPIVEGLDEIRVLLEPPQEPKRDYLTEAVLEVATELKGLRCLMVRLLNEMERRNDEASGAG